MTSTTLTPNDSARLEATLARIDRMIAELASFEGSSAAVTCAREFGPFQYEVGFLRDEICGFLDGEPPQSKPADGRPLNVAQQVDHYMWVTDVYEGEVAKWRQMVASSKGRASNA